MGPGDAALADESATVLRRTEIPLNLEGDVGAPENSAFLVRLENGAGDVKLILNPAPHYDGYYTPSGWAPPHLTSLCLPASKSPKLTVCLFNLTADPTERRNIALEQYSLTLGLIERLIKSYMFDPRYRKLQNFTRHDEGLPSRHGGVWMPWLT